MHRQLINALVLLFTTQAGADLLYVADFEKKDLRNWIKKKHCCKDTVGLVGAPLPVRTGSTMGRSSG